MNKVASFIIVGLFLIGSQANAFIIDGDISDWGIDLYASGADLAGYLDSNVPGGTVDYVTEDNADKNSRNFQVGPGYTLVGNQYDAEAMYFDNDDTYAYVAIVSGLANDEVTYPAGDIFLATEGNPFSSLSYDFAIDVFTGNLYVVGGMEDVKYIQHGISNPWRLTRNADGAVAGENLFVSNIDLVYSSLQNTHSVIEAKIPLAMLNVDQDIWLHWTMKCGNDYLNLQGAVATPEPATGALLVSGMIGIFGFYRRKKI